MRGKHWQVKVSLSDDALEVLCQMANADGFVPDKRRRLWEGRIYEEPWRYKGLGEWIEKRVVGRDLRDVRGVREEELRLAGKGKLINWKEMFFGERYHRQNIRVNQEILNWAVWEGARWGMLPNSISGAAFLGMLLEAIGSGYLEVVDD